jgi:hypothetical protein
MKMAVFWVVAPCSLLEVYQSVRNFPCIIALMMEVASATERLANFYQSTRRCKPEDSHLYTHCLENLKPNLGCV